MAPLVTTGNVTVVCTSTARPLPAITFGEVLATSDVPGGVVNLLTGEVPEVAPWLASHMDVNAIDLAGVDDDALAASLEEAAAENLKRVRRPAGPDFPGWDAEPGLDAMTWALETKTVWHPIGL